MSINFIPNDPMAQNGPPMRQKAPRANRPSGRAEFDIQNPVAEGVFNVGTPEFLFWQCREAALAAVEAWETVAGNLDLWAPGVPTGLVSRLTRTPAWT